MEESEEFGWAVRMDHKFPERWVQTFRPRWRQIPDLLPLIIRYIIWWIVTWVIRGIKPFIDPFAQTGKQIYGVPLGGIGSGSIGRGFKGEFCRFQMTPGLYTYDICHVDQFILSVRQPGGDLVYQKVLSGAGHPGTLTAWDWTFDGKDGHYRGLYPRAWYTYNIPEQNLVLQCKQVSPVIPHNYKDSCQPMSAFEWTIWNNGREAKDISLIFTFKNGTGMRKWFEKSGDCTSQTFTTRDTRNSNRIKGVALEHKIRGLDVTYGIGCLPKANQSVTTMTQFNLKTGADLWLKLSETGQLNPESLPINQKQIELGVALCCSCTIQPRKKDEINFSLVWHQPLIHFQGRLKQHKRRYAKFLKENQSKKHFSRDNPVMAVQYLTEYCLTNHHEWDEAIVKWQAPVLKDKGLPDWFKSALFNELYFVADGGSVWLEYDEKSLAKLHLPKKKDVRNEVGRFAYLEGHEYRMYNTYDVHFYASFALALLWPQLQLSVQYDMADAIKAHDPNRRIHLFDGAYKPRKERDTVPHDLGDPSEDLFLKLNSYLLHDVAEWRDLNLKFILQVYRDFKLTGDEKYVHDMLPICKNLVQRCMKWDTDGDGLIENSGWPDQTYDAWIMTGPSSYCGSLWLASLYAMIEMTKLSTDNSDLQLYRETLDRGKKSFHDKLWTGTYYKYDSSPGKNSQTIMSDQLCGQWFLAMCDVGMANWSIFPKANIDRALTTIYEKNVQGFFDGRMGAVNGMKLDGKIDFYAMQSEEVWTGVTYALAANMIHQGMTEMGFRTAEGIYRTVYEKIGMGFETPEALYYDGRYRAIGYMRPLAVWSMILAWDLHKKNMSK